jgi:hypothetical protein
LHLHTLLLFFELGSSGVSICGAIYIFITRAVSQPLNGVHRFWVSKLLI